MGKSLQRDEAAFEDHFVVLSLSKYKMLSDE